ncbi:MAG: sulfotransferase, partial [Arenicella sp.]|nr:sulfotransferase [Arenicella sp.]
CIDAITADVANPIAYFLLGVIALEHENYAKAEELFSVAEKHDPAEPYYPAFMAKTMTILRRHDVARAAADRAAAMPIDSADILDILAVVYSRTGYHELAIPLFKRAISLKPGNANMQYNLGASAQFVGDFDLAESAYREALQIKPNFYRAWASLVHLSKQTDHNNSLSKLIELFENKAKNSDAQLQLGHAIAKTYEDFGDFKASLNWLYRAKRAKKNELPYDRVSGVEIFDAAKRTVEQPIQSVIPMEAAAGAALPIFIVGLPRTGTTLVDRILSSHSRVTSAGELNTFADLIKKHSGSKSNLVLDAATLNRSGAIDLAVVGRQYLDASAKLARGSDFMVDKMPLNFFYAGLIHKALPDARVIALRRDALDSCISNFRQLFSVTYSFYNYTYDLHDVAWFYRQFDTLMAHWRAVLPDDRFMEVQYEDIVYHQQEQTRRLLDFCGLDWEDACLNFHHNEAPVSTASSVQVRQPLYSGSIGRWKKYGKELDALKAAIFSPAE